MVVDGAEPEVVRRAMELDIESYEEHARAAARIWKRLAVTLPPSASWARYWV